MAKAAGVAASTVWTIRQAHGLAPHRWRQFELSNDPAFVETLTGIVGFHVAPPAHAAMLSIDGKPQIQALDRTRPSLPLKTGHGAAMTHDYKPHGAVRCPERARRCGIGQYDARHRRREFLKRLDRIERAIPAGAPIHAILDNHATHKHSKVRAWLAKHPRWTFHFTPTSCSWLNAVEGFFAKLTRRRLEHGVFRSVGELQDAIHRFIDEHNTAEAKPFIRTAQPGEIVAARKRRGQTLDSIR